MSGEIRQKIAKLAGVQGGKSMEAITVPSSAMGRKDSDELFTVRSHVRSSGGLLLCCLNVHLDVLFHNIEPSCRTRLAFACFPRCDPLLCFSINGRITTSCKTILLTVEGVEMIYADRCRNMPQFTHSYWY